jgi:hypothetical protein
VNKDGSSPAVAPGQRLPVLNLGKHSVREVSFLVERPKDNQMVCVGNQKMVPERDFVSDAHLQRAEHAIDCWRVMHLSQVQELSVLWR